LTTLEETREGGSSQVKQSQEPGAAVIDAQDTGEGLGAEQIEAPPHMETRDWTEMVSLRDGWKANIEKLERSLVQRALAEAGGNKSKAAEALGIHRRLLYEKLRRYGMNGH
jgi:DNA-binding NtrC family response regulator